MFVLLATLFEIDTTASCCFVACFTAAHHLHSASPSPPSLGRVSLEAGSTRIPLQSKRGFWFSLLLWWFDGLESDGLSYALLLLLLWVMKLALSAITNSASLLFFITCRDHTHPTPHSLLHEAQPTVPAPLAAHEDIHQVKIRLHVLRRPLDAEQTQDGPQHVLQLGHG